jgi:sulfite reductase alpha subunit-like flavoprotein
LAPRFTAHSLPPFNTTDFFNTSNIHPHSPNIMTDKILTIIYGSETGNGKGLAASVAKKAEKNGVKAMVFDMESYDAALVGTLMHPVLFIVSTWDDGLPPQKARGFFRALKLSSDLQSLNYTVLALGDPEYPKFCKAGETLDATFKELGAKSFLPLEKLGPDFQVTYIGWSRKFWQSLAVIYGVAQ